MLIRSGRINASCFSGTKRFYVARVNPTSIYTAPTFDRPRYSLKRFNMQLSQSVFTRSPNLERTTVVYKVMKYDGVKGDHITFYILFSAVLEHQIWDQVSVGCCIRERVS